MNEDMSQYMGVFLDEANEQLELLEQDILKLEQEPSQELLQEIFRAAHTLKGSSRAMGFTSMGELTHAMEDVFDKLRQDALTVNGELIDALFSGLDMLKVMKDEIAAVGNSDVDSALQTARLRAVLTGDAPPAAAAPVSVPAPPPAKAAAAAPSLPEVPAPAQAVTFKSVLTASEMMAFQEAKASGWEVYCLIVSIAPDCVMKSVRALMTLQAIERVGSVLATTPGEEAIENEEFESSFEVLVATGQSAGVLYAAAKGVTEITEVLMQPWAIEAAKLYPITPAAAPPQPKTAPEEAAAAAEAVRAAEDERKLDAGPEARGKPHDEVQRIATDKKGQSNATQQGQTVRVDVTRLDKLLNLVGELVIDRTRIAQLGGQFERQFEFNDMVENLNETAAHIGRITDELQEEIMKARMLPIDNVFNRFPRMIRDLAQKLEKEINFVVEGKETELDRSVIEIIGDPLIHMLRNSVDHGIEMPDEREKAGKPRCGTVRLCARHEENHIVIEIHDDGGGIDPDKMRANAVKKGLMAQDVANRMTDRDAINLIFASGFSTAAVVSDVSGRGVGMDIVKSNLQKLGAQIDIDSKVGRGSTFRVKLPLTLAIIRGLLVIVRGCVYVLPLTSVVETIKVQTGSVHVVNHREVIVQRGNTLPIVRLRNVFHLEAETTPAERTLAKEIRKPRRGKKGAVKAEELVEAEEAVVASHNESNAEALYLVVVGLAEKQVGLVVDSLIGEQEIVIKTLGKFIGDIKGISGATILGDGRVALIVDVNGLVNIAIDEKGNAYAA